MRKPCDHGESETLQAEFSLPATVLNGKLTLRLAIGNSGNELGEMCREAWELLQKAGGQGPNHKGHEGNTKVGMKL